MPQSTPSHEVFKVPPMPTVLPPTPERGKIWFVVLGRSEGAVLDPKTATDRRYDVLCACGSELRQTGIAGSSQKVFGERMLATTKAKDQP